MKFLKHENVPIIGASEAMVEALPCSWSLSIVWIAILIGITNEIAKISC